jgi:hypothetical protein
MEKNRRVIQIEVEAHDRDQPLSIGGSGTEKITMNQFSNNILHYYVLRDDKHGVVVDH